MYTPKVPIDLAKSKSTGTFVLTLLFIFVGLRFGSGNGIFGMYVLYAMTGARFQALTAVNALAVIDNRHVVDQMDCTVGASPFALTASNAARFALAHNVLTAAFGRTSDIYFCRLGNTLY